MKTRKRGRDSSPVPLNPSLETLYSGSEDEFILEMERCRQAIPNHNFASYEPMNESVLHIAVNRDFLKAALYLLAYQHPVDLGIKPEDKSEHNPTPFITACSRNNIPMVQLLLDYGANFLFCMQTEHNAAMVDQNEITFEFLLAEAVKRNCLEKLLFPDGSSFNIYEITIIQRNIQRFKRLLQIQNFHTLLSILKKRELLHFIRQTSWESPELYSELDPICKELRAIFGQLYPNLSWQQHRDSNTLVNSYQNLFAKPYKPGKKLHNKERMLEHVLAQFDNILQNPQQALSLLQPLNKSLIEYYRVHLHIFPPMIARECYEVKVINGIPFPIPTDAYRLHKKYRGLQIVLINLLRQHNLGSQAFKWLGFIPEEIANASYRNGDFVTDVRLTNGLFHGKLTHMLQTAILIYAIQQGLINTVYVEDGVKKHLTVLEILQASLDQRSPDGATLFARSRDYRHYNEISFGDPYCFNSIVMLEGRNAGIGELADFMIDSFCHGFCNFKDLYAQKLQKNISNAELADEMGDIDMKTFVTNFIDEYKDSRTSESLYYVSGNDEPNPFSIFVKNYPDTTVPSGSVSVNLRN